MQYYSLLPLPVVVVAVAVGVQVVVVVVVVRAQNQKGVEECLEEGVEDVGFLRL